MKLLPIILFTLCFHQATCQLGSLPETGSIYTYWFHNVFSPEDQRFLYVWGDDFNQNDTIYRKFYKEGSSQDTLLIREEDNKWYIRNIPYLNLEGSESLIYDWTVNEGDTVSSLSISIFENPHSLIVDSIQNIQTLDGITRKQYFLSSLELPDIIDPVIWIEGVAGFKYLFEEAAGLEIQSSSGYKMICAEINNQLVYESPYSEFLIDYENCNWSITNITEFIENPQLKIYPNPCESIINLNLNETVNKVIVLALDGKILKEFTLASNSTEIQINLDFLAPGSYFIGTMGEGQNYARRFQRFIKL